MRTRELSALLKHEGEDASRIPRRGDDGPAPLSFAQQRLWFLDRLVPGNAFYNVDTTLPVYEGANEEALERAINALVARHETLRTSFVEIDGRPMQVIAPSAHVPLQRVDFRSSGVEAAGQFINDEALRPFDLASGPLLRTFLVRLSDAYAALLIVTHHIISDGWSLGITVQELMRLYAAFAAGQDDPLPPLAIQYADFACWQRQWLSGAELERQLAYWRTQLTDLPSLELRADRPRPRVPTFAGARIPLHVPPGLAARLRELARQHNATLFMLLLAAYDVLLHRYTDQTDVVVGAPIANRTRAETEHLIGFFVNTLVLRADLSGDPTFVELLGRIRQTTLAAYTHQDLPFEKLVEELQPERDLSRNPLFQVTFQLFNAPSVDAPDAVPLGAGDFRQGTSKFDLRLDAWETRDGGIGGQLEYSTDLFERDTAARLLERYLLLLESIAASPHERVSRLTLLSAAERRRLTGEWNDTATAYPRDRSVHELFDETAAAQPDAPAVSALDGTTVTYGELARRTTEIAAFLQTNGISRGDIVPLLFERGADLVAAMLAVLRCGAAYLPLDVAYPPERLKMMMEECAAKFVVAPRELAHHVPDDVRVLSIDQIAPGAQFIPPSVGGADRAYVMYTSGSTGVPKGVVIPHRGIVRLVRNTNYLGLQPNETVAQMSTAAFDAATMEIFGPLLNGARVLIIPKEVALSAHELAHALRANHVDVLFITTSLFHQHVAELPDVFSTLRLLMVGGSLADPRWFREVLQHGAPRQFLHVYGPTENTTFSTAYDMAAFTGELTSIPIGRPIANSTAFVLDRHLEPQPIGVPGELYVGGDGLAEGYLAAPELTAKRFIDHPSLGVRLYRTGDQARVLAGGDIEFLGRQDDQIKLRGYRVELGEIEATLAQHPAVAENACTVREDRHADQRLVAYVSLVDDYFTDDSANDRESTAFVEQWMTTFDQVVYGSMSAGDSDADFNIAGWISSYTGEPIPAQAMREQVERTVERIAATRPRRVLEIGCGTGMLLFRLAPSCTRYVGTDFSAAALHWIDQHRSRLGDAAGRVELLQRAADDFSAFEPATFDAVVLNSVVQYFPSIDYLLSVLQQAARVLAPGGMIFLGDVRSFPLLEMLHTSIELSRAADADNMRDVEERILRALAQEQELTVDPAFFSNLHRWLPSVTAVQVQLKRGCHDHELTRFRYDVLLQVGGPAVEIDCAWQEWREETTLEEVRRQVTALPGRALGIRGIPNARIAGDAAALQIAPQAGDVGSVRRQVAAQRSTAEDPEQWWSLAGELPVEVLIHGSTEWRNGTFDALIIRRDAVAADAIAHFPADTGVARPLAAYANVPLQGRFVRQLVPELQGFLKGKLPEYMIPGAFVLLDALPLGPTGKVNRAALPAPERSRPLVETSLIRPRNDVERRIAAIWSAVLNVDDIGVHDHFFSELGGHSLLATQVISRIAVEFGVSLPLRTIFDRPTVAHLAEVLASATSSAESPLLPILRRDHAAAAADRADALFDQLGLEES